MHAEGYHTFESKENERFSSLPLYVYNSINHNANFETCMEDFGCRANLEHLSYKWESTYRVSQTFGVVMSDSLPVAWNVCKIRGSQIYIERNIRKLLVLQTRM
jgi:hypothetical protein